MKISFMTFACPQWTFEQVVDAAVEHGYQGVEFRCDSKHFHGVEVTATAAERRKFTHQLELANVSACCLATSLRFATDQAVKEAPPLIALAADLGCPLLRVFAGGRPDGWDADSAIAKVGDQLREIADVAEQANVQLLLETHDTMSRGVHAAAAVRRANHPAIAINYDNMHPYRMGEPLDATFAALDGLIRHCHLHDALNSPDTVVIKPMGQGEMPMDAMFAALVKTGFNGYISGEWFHNHYGQDADESLARFHRDVMTLAKRHNVRMG